jgi:hypothetical protein
MKEQTQMSGKIERKERTIFCVFIYFNSILHHNHWINRRPRNRAADSLAADDPNS